MLLAIIDFVEVVLRLICAFMLSCCPENGLVFYCLFLLGIQLLSTGIKLIYCVRNYSECKSFKIGRFDKEMAKDMFPFMGWNMLESTSWLAKSQGVAILMNTFYGTIVNASYGIANQINGQIMFFSSTLLNAIKPQIFKSAGNKDYSRMMRLAYSASKFAFLMLLSIFIPIHFMFSDILNSINNYSFNNF